MIGTTSWYGFKNNATTSRIKLVRCRTKRGTMACRIIKFLSDFGQLEITAELNFISKKVRADREA